MSAAYIPWTLAALRRAGSQPISAQFRPETRMLRISNRLSLAGCTLQWDPQRRSLIVVLAYPRPYPDNR